MHTITDVTEAQLEKLWINGVSFRYGTIRQGKADIVIDKDEDYNKAMELIGNENNSILPNELSEKPRQTRN